jgi:phage portal protein BeeE
MNIREAVGGAGRRVGEVSMREWLANQRRRATELLRQSTNAFGLTNLLARGRAFAGEGLFGSRSGQVQGSRRTMGTGSNLAPFSFGGFPSAMVPGGGGRTGVSAPHNLLPKRTPANLRRFAETPVARRAINVIKDRIAGMKWRIQARSGRSIASLPDGELRAQILTENFEAPNPDDSFRSFVEQVLEDVIVGGFGAVELDRVEGWELPRDEVGRRDAALTAGETPALRSGELPSAEVRSAGQPGAAVLTLPLLMWPVDGASIRMISGWDGRPDSPRYVQVTGLYGADGQIILNDDELSYIRLNPRTHTPFGLGRVEVAFETINDFLSAHRYAGRLASNSVVQYALWLQGLTPANHERLIRWWQDEIEGTGRVPIMSAETKPEVLRFAAGNDADLRLAWQEFLIRIIADAFDLPAQFLGVTSDVNRATAAEMTEMAFRSAIVPTARLVAEHLTRDAIGKKLGWTDLEFVFADVDATDEMQQAQIDEILLRNGVLTVNEVRRARGLEEIV